MKTNTRRVALAWSALLAALTFAHSWIFQRLAGQLVRDDPRHQADVAVIVDGDGRYEWDSDRYANGSIDKLLLVQAVPKRLHEFGVLPYPHERARAEPMSRGVDAEDFLLIDDPVRDVWEVADRLDRWLADRPDATGACVTDRLGSRSVDEVFRQTVAPDGYDRITIHALRDRRYDQSDWWKSRRGLKSFYGAAVSFLTARFAGRPEYRYEDDWDPDGYEGELLGYRG